MTTHISPPYGDKSLNKIIEEAIKNNWERPASPTWMAPAINFRKWPRM